MLTGRARTASNAKRLATYVATGSGNGNLPDRRLIAISHTLAADKYTSLLVSPIWRRDVAARRSGSVFHQSQT